ncbi:thioesterase domain-containing protein [Aspergillus stella-maris]|uniref:thioesterase domain-containing protein n=1 Tax=Aspergillus stella-maris TaxID=1810926 RepID=UPI003CCDD956
MDPVFQVQRCPKSRLAPLFLIHAISGLALPYNSLNTLDSRGRTVYGISSPIYGPRRYRLPSSIYDVARQYIHFVRSKQATGPYLLGGWSFGGLVALKMAEILSAQGEKILQVIMIDTPNPISRPPWGHEDQEALAVLTYNAIAQRAGQPVLDAQQRTSSHDNEARVWKAGANAAAKKDESVAMWQNMYKHIYNVLTLVERAADGDFVSAMDEVKVSFVKCSVLEIPPAGLISEPSRKFYFDRYKDEYMGWNSGWFSAWEAYSLDAEHNSVFDPAHVGDLARILSGIVDKVVE